ncbi:hypothetical protein [Oceanirhabdus sp. W0125-5]|uniref:hypothetical protein n=1 Tax=Oceanirhabdus sp. W0125-5 TaxID=2999116 RepID=UPI0022F2C6B7|nr:hypothetical protein [Oceanirhabdus sp. W0125-5]WBW97139.1 hypothetical protein OW730_26125 [Oceanirhabdus sp. W0125-5]
MEYGSNNKLLIEILQFVNKNKLFSAQLNSINDIKIIHDFDKAVSLALDDENWNDIREEEMSKVWEVLYKMSNYQEIFFPL